MKTYFVLQIKRLFKIWPLALVVSIILLLGVSLILGSFLQYTANSDENQVFRVGVAGDTNNAYFQLAETAFQTLDASRYTISIEVMEEEEAYAALNAGDISAYVVLPDGFVTEALRGKMLPISFVSSTGTSGPVTMMKDEIARMIETLLVYSQKGVYGLQGALTDAGATSKEYRAMDRLALEYTDSILHRSHVYRVEELGISSGLPMAWALGCGIAVVFLLLMALPYAPLFMKTDLALSRVLTAKGTKACQQVAAEWAAFTVAVGALVYLLLVLGLCFVGDGWFLLWQVLPVLLLTTSLSFLLFEIAGTLVSGVLLHFFITVALGYLSGCLYPIYTFPVSVQNVAVYLPTGAARVYLSHCVAGENVIIPLLFVMGYTLMFITAAVLVRRYRLAERV